MFLGELLVVIVQAVSHNRLQVVFEDCAHSVQNIVAAQFLLVQNCLTLLDGRIHLLVNYVLQVWSDFLRGPHRAADELPLKTLTRLSAPLVRWPEERCNHCLITVVVELW